MLLIPYFLLKTKTLKWSFVYFSYLCPLSFFLMLPYIILIARSWLSNHTDYITQGIHILGTRTSFSLHQLDRTSFYLHRFKVFKYFKKRGFLNAFFLFLSIDKAYYSTFIILKTVIATIWIYKHFLKRESMLHFSRKHKE